MYDVAKKQGGVPDCMSKLSLREALTAEMVFQIGQLDRQPCFVPNRPLMQHKKREKYSG